MDDRNLVTAAGAEKQDFTSQAPLVSTSAPPLRRSKRIENARKSSSVPSGAAKRKRSPSADAGSPPATKSSKTNTKTRSNDSAHHSEGDIPRGEESKASQDSVSPNSPEISPISNGEQPFRLFDLPPELWVSIGKMAIDDISYIDLADYDAFNTGAEIFADLRTPAILHTCSALRKELRMYYYASQKVRAALDEDQSFARPLRGYVQAIGSDARRQMQEITMLSYTECDSAGPPDPPQDLSSIWGVELVLDYERASCGCLDGTCGLDKVDWKVIFK